MLLFKLHIKIDPFQQILEHIRPEQIILENKYNLRTPIIPFDTFEQDNPKIAAFIKSCWNFEIKTLENLKNKYPN